MLLRGELLAPCFLLLQPLHMPHQDEIQLRRGDAAPVSRAAGDALLALEAQGQSWGRMHAISSHRAAAVLVTEVWQGRWQRNARG
jgi:hypothetical protein